MAAVFVALAASALPARAAPWAGNRNRFAAPQFEQVWRTADLAVQQGRTGRSWTWGPQPWFDYYEVYKQSPQGLRLVQYFDKTRMEINDPANSGGPLGGVTNGLLVVELVSGRMKLGQGTGPDENQPRRASLAPVAGDIPQLGHTSPTAPSYASFARVATTDNGYRDPNRVGQRVGTTFGPNGELGFDQSLANVVGTDIARYESMTGHNIPSVFDDFLNAGPIPAIASFGYPITDAYWITARVAGQERRVLVQLFERRALTYTPGNPREFLVEMGNVGQHYFLWRYEGMGQPWATPDPRLPITFATNQGGKFAVERIDPQGMPQGGTPGADTDLVPSSILRWWLPEVPQYHVVYGDTTSFNGKRQLAALLPQAGIRNRVLTSDANDYEPAISPDGSQIAFVSDRDGNPELYLLIRGPSGDSVARLTDTRDCANGHPSWVSNGLGLAFESNCQGNNFEIYLGGLSYTLDANARIVASALISPGSARVQRLTSNTTDDRWPRLSPDSSQIAFFSFRDGNSEIYTLSSAGGRETRLTNSAGQDEAPAWSPDGAQIVFNSNRDGDHELYIMNRDGTGQRQLTYNAFDDGYAVWGP